MTLTKETEFVNKLREQHLLEQRHLLHPEHSAFTNQTCIDLPGNVWSMWSFFVQAVPVWSSEQFAAALKDAGAKVVLDVRQGMTSPSEEMRIFTSHQSATVTLFKLSPNRSKMKRAIKQRSKDKAMRLCDHVVTLDSTKMLQCSLYLLWQT